MIYRDTIAAISTGGVGGIGIVRVSGENSISIVNQLFQSKNGASLFDKKSLGAKLFSS